MPLLGLGSDQVKKASREEKGITAYHVVEFCTEDGRLLRESLLNKLKAESKTTTRILFMLPQLLTDHVDATMGMMRPSICLTNIKKLAEKGQISLMCIDDAHSVEQQGRYFRPDIQEADKKLQQIHNGVKTKCPHLVISATLWTIYQETISKLL